MPKYLNEDYEEVEAYSPEEVAAKVKEATEKLSETHKAEIQKKDEEITTVTTEKEKLSKKFDSRNEEYNNLKTKFDEVSGGVDQAAADKTAAFEKMRDDAIKKAAGEDKEYAEELTKQFARLQTEETLDSEVIGNVLKESHALAMTALDREVTAFSMGDTPSGDAPTTKPEGEKSFSETPEGEATYEHIATAMGQTPSKPEGDKK